MIEEPLHAIGVILAVAIGCQWLAERLRIPSVLLLLMAGVATGSVIDPDELLGELLFPLVSLGVGILLFEGGLSLRWKQLGAATQPVVRIVTLGVLVTWAVGAIGASTILDLDTDLALLLGAILTVSGPTVVIPLVRAVRPREPSASILRWEGILIDPVGATLAIVVLDTILEEKSTAGIIVLVISTIAAGLVVGVTIGVVLVELLRLHQISDHLQIPVTLAAVVGAFAGADALRPEAGLVATTVVGLVIANQRRTSAGHIYEFNENLGSIVLGVLFIILGARVDLDAVIDEAPAALALLALLILIARPLAVLAATAGTSTGWRDRAFITLMAPRGVVAASVASLFALELEEHGIDPGPMVEVTFVIVVGSVALAAATARLAARWLHVAQPDPTGVALIGGHRFALDLAERLAALRVPVLLVGLDDQQADAAAERGLLTYRGRLDAEDLLDVTKAVGIRTAVALSGTDHLDAYGITRLTEAVGRANVYRLGHDGADGAGHSDVSARLVLPDRFTPTLIEELLDDGHTLDTQSADALVDGWVVICAVTEEGEVKFEADETHRVDGDHLIVLGPGLSEPASESEPEPST